MFKTIYRKELSIASRNLKVPAAVIANNGILGLVAIFSYYLEFYSKGRLGKLVHGKEILNIFTLMTTIEFVFVIISMFLLTVPCILRERRNNSYDILITSGVTPMKYLWAKLISRVTIVAEVTFAASPILGIAFYVGGVSIKNLIGYYVILLVTAFYIGAIGIWCSCICKKKIGSTVCAYLLGFLVICGTLMIVAGVYMIKKVSLGIALTDFKSQVNLGSISLLLLINPLYNFLRMVNQQFGVMNEILDYISMYDKFTATMRDDWIMASNGIQILLTLLLVYRSARKLRIKRNKKAI